MKVQFGSGSNILPGWENYDKEVDARNKLPWGNDTVDFIFSEHMIEHLSFVEGCGFLRECLRILKPGGVLRLGFPDFTKIENASQEDRQQYLAMLECNGKPAGNTVDIWQAIFFGWGHRSVWTEQIAVAVLLTVGFDMTVECEPLKSDHVELRDIDIRHLDLKMSRCENAYVEGSKAI